MSSFNRIFKIRNLFTFLCLFTKWISNCKQTMIHFLICAYYPGVQCSHIFILPSLVLVSGWSSSSSSTWWIVTSLFIPFRLFHVETLLLVGVRWDESLPYLGPAHHHNKHAHRTPHTLQSPHHSFLHYLSAFGLWATIFSLPFFIYPFNVLLFFFFKRNSSTKV